MIDLVNVNLNKNQIDKSNLTKDNPTKDSVSGSELIEDTHQYNGSEILSMLPNPIDEEYRILYNESTIPENYQNSPMMGYQNDKFFYNLIKNNNN